jgi:cytochrome c oxidase cbb3-type subunit 1
MNELKEERLAMNSITESTYSDTVVRQFTLMTVVWGVVGMLVGLIIAAQLAWPELNFGISCHLIHLVI